MKKKKKNKSIKKILKEHPEWLPKVMTHESMLADGYIESFRVKSTDGYSQDEIWYKRG